MNLITKKKSHYDNVLLLDIDGKPISTIDFKRLEFYKKNNLIDEEEDKKGYSGVYKLRFKANINYEVKDIHYLPVENRCVISGDKKDLTLHHVVPYCIRKHLPVKYKGKSKEWCVLLRYDIHSDIENDVLKLYQKDMNDYYHKNSKHLRKYKKQFELIKLIEDDYWKLIPDEKQIKLMAQAHIYDIDELSNQSSEDINLKYIKKKTQVYKDWVYDFIKRHGGIKNTYEMFGEHFKETFKPEYLPKGYLLWNFD